MDLLTNAIESIQVGVADYDIGTRPRLLSSVRNIHAGILLLFKEALLRHSPEGSEDVLIKAKAKPIVAANGQVVFVGVGRKTADTQQIRERFESLGIAADWDRLKGIADLRNDIEHFYPTITKKSLAGLIASSFVVIRNFITTELEENPRDLLGQLTWRLMLEVTDVYEVERRECDQTLKAVNWKSKVLAEGILMLQCAQCASDLLRPSREGEYDTDMTMQCRICGHEVDADTFVPEVVGETLGYEAHMAAKDGADGPYFECPGCNTESYVLTESRCAYCGINPERDCSGCGHSIPPSELGSSPLCGYCDHMASKRD